VRKEGIRERTGLAVHSAHTEVHHVATWGRRWSLGGGGGGVGGGGTLPLPVLLYRCYTAHFLQLLLMRRECSANEARMQRRGLYVCTRIRVWLVRKRLGSNNNIILNPNCVQRQGVSGGLTTFFTQFVLVMHVFHHHHHHPLPVCFAVVMGAPAISASASHATSTLL
jgi:hypothetical protein